MKTDSSLWTRVARSMLGPYALALGVTALGLLARWALDPVLGNFVPYTVLFPGIVFLAFYVGRGPTIVAIVLSCMGVIYWFVPPRGSFAIAGSAHIVGALSFLAAGACIAIAGELSRKSQTQLQHARTLVQTFLDTVPAGLTRCSRDLRFVAVNPAYAQMLRLSVEKIVGRPIIDVIGAEAWEKIRPYVERVLRGERVEYEMPLAYASGGTVYVHVVYTPDRDSTGEVVGWVASVTDITESKRVEKQLARVEKLAAAGQLAASLAHEINNPLSTVTNVLYLLKTNSNLDKPASSLADTAANELERVARIVRQSLAYYRVGTTAQEVDLGASVEESLQIFGEKFQRAGIHVRQKIAPKTLMMGFPDEIRQVVDNLLLNALEATPSGGRLAVGVRWARDWKKVGQGGVRLTIADSGQGIPEEQLAMISEPFFTTKAERGTGLGLWVVQGVVAKHDASMKFRSVTQEGRSGTVVSILWPSSRWGEREKGLARSESAA